MTNSEQLKQTNESTSLDQESFSDLNEHSQSIDKENLDQGKLKTALELAQQRVINKNLIDGKEEL